MDPKRIKAVPLFANLSKKQLEELGRLADEVTVAAGTHLADQGRFAYEFFVVEDGTVEVQRDGKTLATLGPGDFFGEVGLLETQRRNATVLATTETRLIVMASREFSTMLQDMPRVAEQIKKAAEQRLQPAGS